MQYKKAQSIRALTVVILTGLITLTGCGGPGAEHFNETAADPDSKPDQVLAELNIQPGLHIADIGAGGGYFALRFAEATGPDGKVYAVDVNPDFLTFIDRAAQSRGLQNITTVRGTADSAALEPGSVDLVFSRNVFHHIENQTGYFKNLKPALRPNARVVLIDHTEHGFRFVSLFGHHSTPGEIRKKMEAAGYVQIDQQDFLMPDQSFQVFQVAVE